MKKRLVEFGERKRGFWGWREKYGEKKTCGAEGMEME